MAGEVEGAAPDARDTRRHLLLAVEDSEDSRRAVMYVADFFGGYADIYVTLLSILGEPPEDLFGAATEREQWLARERAARQATLERFRAVLLAAGLREERVATRLVVRRYASLAEAILEEQEQLRCCIIVVGRRGLSRHEEFLFGSTSSRILHRATHCAVMVVE
jgi:nucleotide-binding universal stress UspA family protein